MVDYSLGNCYRCGVIHKTLGFSKHQENKKSVVPTGFALFQNDVYGHWDRGLDGEVT